MKRITIDPVTRLEGHGKIEIFLDDNGNVANAYFQVPELRGFEKFVEGRPIEEMPRITPRICGICPDAHLMASAKACDDAFGIEIPDTARKLRELQYSAFVLQDHITHFYALGGPDFIVGPSAPKSKRNILGVIEKTGPDVGKALIRMRRECHEISKMIGGKPINPVNALPGGVSKGINSDEQKRIIEIADNGINFCKMTFKLFKEIILDNSSYIDMIKSDAYAFPTYYMGLVDEKNRVNFYDGKVRITDPNGREFCKYSAHEYLDHISEHVEPWTYLKFPYLKKIGWKGLVGGIDSGVYQATPLGRLNTADGMATELSQGEYEKMYKLLGPKPIHNNLAMHWARIIESMYSAERLMELARDTAILGNNYRTISFKIPKEGIGIVEAPRGTLTHHYFTDDKGIIIKTNLIVGTTNNHASICMSIKKAAESLIKDGNIDDGILNRVEMAFRSYDPCYGCATHSLPGETPLEIVVYDSKKGILKEIVRD